MPTRPPPVPTTTEPPAPTTTNAGADDDGAAGADDDRAAGADDDRAAGADDDRAAGADGDRRRCRRDRAVVPTTTAAGADDHRAADPGDHRAPPARSDGGDGTQPTLAGFLRVGVGPALLAVIDNGSPVTIFARRTGRSPLADWPAISADPVLLERFVRTRSAAWT